MLIIVLAVLAVASVPLAGGRLGRLAGLRLRRIELLALALGLQVLVISVVPTWPRGLLVAGHLVSYLLAAEFVWLNRRVSGLPVLALGGALNGLAIALNGGTLPAAPGALGRAGIRPAAAAFTNSGVLAHPRLAWLGDVFAVPAGVPFANVFSVGDVLILAGLTFGLHVICESRICPRGLRRPGNEEEVMRTRATPAMAMVALSDGTVALTPASAQPAAAGWALASTPRTWGSTADLVLPGSPQRSRVWRGRRRPADEGALDASAGAPEAPEVTPVDGDATDDLLPVDEPGPADEPGVAEGGPGDERDSADEPGPVDEPRAADQIAPLAESTPGDLDPTGDLDPAVADVDPAGQNPTSSAEPADHPPAADGATRPAGRPGRHRRRPWWARVAAAVPSLAPPR